MAYGTLQIGRTGPSGRIGSGTEFHIDSKYGRGMSWEDIVGRFDAKAGAYGKDGRNIVFSNEGVQGEVYNPSAPMGEKIDLLQRAGSAHSHSVSDDFHSFDFYAPIGTDIYDKSAEGAPIYITGKHNAMAAGGTSDTYGNFAFVTDPETGAVISKVGHGDTDLDIFKGGQFSVPGGTGFSPDSKQADAKVKAQNYADMSKDELDIAYDKMRNDPNAAAEGMKMHKAFFGKS